MHRGYTVPDEVSYKKTELTKRRAESGDKKMSATLCEIVCTLYLLTFDQTFGLAKKCLTYIIVCFLCPLQTYLDEFKFGNAVYTDLWKHLQMARSPLQMFYTEKFS